MALYQPGRGLSTQATQRLRERKVGGAGFSVMSSLPAEDECRQWEALLGVGAKKKARCSQCTRPLGSAELACRQVLCKRCTTSAAVDLAEQLKLSQQGQQHRKWLQGRGAMAMASLALDEGFADEGKATSVPGCPTPSTQADAASEGDVDSLGSSPPSPDQVMLALLRKRIEGDWVDAEGKRCRIVFSTCDENRITCIVQDSSLNQEYMSFYLDTRDRLVWWGTERSFFLDLSEIEWTSDHITWHDSGNGEKPRVDFEWHRPGTEAEQLKIVRNKIPIGSRFSGQEVVKTSIPRLSELQQDVPGEHPGVSIKRAQDKQRQSPQVPPIGATIATFPRPPQTAKAQVSCNQVPPIGATIATPLRPPQTAKAQVSGNQVSSSPQPLTTPELQVGRWRKRNEERQSSKAQRDGETEADLTALAMEEIDLQLRAPDCKGFVWVDRWNDRFLRSLGTLRDFLESRPDRFVVTPTSGRGFRVSPAKRVCTKLPQWRKKE